METNWWYTVGGAAVGAYLAVATAQGITWLVHRKKPEKKLVQATDQMICSACMSPILGPPIQVVLSDDQSFACYKCGQCGVALTKAV